MLINIHMRKAPLNKPDLIYKSSLSPLPVESRDSNRFPTLKSILKEKEQTDLWHFNGVYSRTKYSRIHTKWVNGVFPDMSF